MKIWDVLRRRWCAAAALSLGALNAVDASIAGPLGSIEVEAGTGNHVDVLAVGVDFRDWFARSPAEGWTVRSYLLARVAYWGSLDDHPAVSAVYDFGVTPVLRVEKNAGALTFFLQLGVGLHVISHTRINTDRTFGSAVQFGEFLGPGVRFGPQGRYEVSVLVQHVSNGGIRNPNDGLTYGSVMFGYNFH